MSGLRPCRALEVIAAYLLVVSVAACVPGGQDAATTPSVPATFVATEKTRDVMHAEVPPAQLGVHYQIDRQRALNDDQ